MKTEDIENLSSDDILLIIRNSNIKNADKITCITHKTLRFYYPDYVNKVGFRLGYEHGAKTRNATMKKSVYEAAELVYETVFDEDAYLDDLWENFDQFEVYREK